MGVRGVPRPEADIARRVRAVVGSKASLVGTFDPHGNEDEEFLRQADMAFTVEYFPHYDSHLQGERAARMLVRAIRGDYKPATVTQRVPIIPPTVLQWTGASPWMDLVQRALTWEAREPDVYVNFFFGFPFADVPDVGMTFQVMTNGDPGLARRVADDMAAAAWRQREALIGSTKVHTIPDGVALAKQAMASGSTPVVLGRPQRPLGLGYLDPEGGHRAGPVGRADCDDRRRQGDRCAQGQGREGGRCVRHGRGRARRRVPLGAPVRVRGTVLVAGEGKGQLWVVVKVRPRQRAGAEPLPRAGHGARLVGARSASTCRPSRRSPSSRACTSACGFDDSGFAKTILLVEPVEPFLGTVRLEGLPYQNVDLKKFYPYGDPKFP